MSKYYIYKMTALTEDGSKGSYIGQHKIGRKSPLNDGYRGSGSDWKKYILSQNIPVEKVILRMCENIEEANYWENYYIESAKAQGIYLWNRTKGGEAHKHDKIYTDEELKEHKKQYSKQYYYANREKRAEYSKQYYEVNREKRAEYNKQWRETNREKIAEYKKQYNNQLCKYNNETLTLSALRNRFLRAGVEHPVIEAKRYLIV